MDVVLLSHESVSLCVLGSFAKDATFWLYTAVLQQMLRTFPAKEGYAASSLADLSSAI